MQSLFASGRIAECVIALMLVEFVGLAWLGRRSGRFAAGRLAPNFAAGLCLLLVWRLSQAGVAWPWVALTLAGAGIAHVVDIRSR